MSFDISQTCLFFDFGLTRGECASWFQAWASILAIGGAIYAVRHAFNLNKKIIDDNSRKNAIIEASDASVILIHAEFEIRYLMEEFLRLSLPVNIREYKKFKTQLNNIKIHSSKHMVSLHLVGEDFFVSYHKAHRYKFLALGLVQKIIAGVDKVEDYRCEIEPMLKLLQNECINSNRMLVKFIDESHFEV